MIRFAPLLLLILPGLALAETQQDTARVIEQHGSTESGQFTRSPFFSRVRITGCQAEFARYDAGRGDALIERYMVDLSDVDLGRIAVQRTRRGAEIHLPLRAGAESEATTLDISASAALTNKALGEVSYVTTAAPEALYVLSPPTDDAQPGWLVLALRAYAGEWCP